MASPQDRGMPLNVIRQLEGALINDLLQEAIFWGGQGCVRGTGRGGGVIRGTH